VLVVDDERSMLLAMTLSLRTDGWEVISASHADEADQRFNDRSVSLVVLDYMLPETDGLALAQTWRRGGSDVPILLVSAQTDGPVVWRALKLGIIDMIAKPMDPDQLRRRVRSMAERPSLIGGVAPESRLVTGLYHLQQQQPLQTLDRWSGLHFERFERGFSLLRAFALQLARDEAAVGALAAAGWPTSWHLSGGPDIFVEYCRRTEELLSSDLTSGPSPSADGRVSWNGGGGIASGF
jgi:DNA-binding response OmpR family regulator